MTDIIIINIHIIEAREAYATAIMVVGFKVLVHRMKWLSNDLRQILLVASSRNKATQINWLSWASDRKDEQNHNCNLNSGFIALG